MWPKIPRRQLSDVQSDIDAVVAVLSEQLGKLRELKAERKSVLASTRLAARHATNRAQQAVAERAIKAAGVINRRLPPMSAGQRRQYDKLRYAGLGRDEALKEVMTFPLFEQAKERANASL
jgi:hypothetical protein